MDDLNDLSSRLEAVKAMFDKAIEKAYEAVRIAEEELKRPITNKEKKEDL